MIEKEPDRLARTPISEAAPRLCTIAAFCPCGAQIVLACGKDFRFLSVLSEDRTSLIFPAGALRAVAGGDGNPGGRKAQLVSSFPWQ